MATSTIPSALVNAKRNWFRTYDQRNGIPCRGTAIFFEEKPSLSDVTFTILTLLRAVLIQIDDLINLFLT